MVSFTNTTVVILSYKENSPVSKVCHGFLKSQTEIHNFNRKSAEKQVSEIILSLNVSEWKFEDRVRTLARLHNWLFQKKITSCSPRLPCIPMATWAQRFNVTHIDLTLKQYSVINNSLNLLNPKPGRKRGSLSLYWKCFWISYEKKTTSVHKFTSLKVILNKPRQHLKKANQLRFNVWQEPFGQQQATTWLSSFDHFPKLQVHLPTKRNFTQYVFETTWTLKEAVDSQISRPEQYPNLPGNMTAA